MYCRIAGLSRLMNYWGKYQTRRELSKGGITFLDSRGAWFFQYFVVGSDPGNVPKKNPETFKENDFLSSTQAKPERKIFTNLYENY